MGRCFFPTLFHPKLKSKTDRQLTTRNAFVFKCCAKGMGLKEAVENAVTAGPPQALVCSGSRGRSPELAVCGASRRREEKQVQRDSREAFRCNKPLESFVGETFTLRFKNT